MKFDRKIFLAHIAGQALSRLGRDTVPYVGVDERINASQLTNTLRRLADDHVISGSKPLWDQRMASPTGPDVYAPGRLSTRSRERAETHDTQPVWPEESILASLFIEFTVRDRVVLLTCERQHDSAAMRQLLGREVRNDMEAVQQHGLGLLVIGQSRATSLMVYAAEVEALLRSKPVAAGYADVWL